MNIFDIVGPVMVGPSSSHTAGAVRIGNTCRKLMAEPIADAKIGLHGSFLATGKGHGTDRALVAGLLGLAVDDVRIPDSFELAEKNGLKFSMSAVDLGEDAHPNSVQMELTSVSGRKMEVIAASVGGGRILIKELDGMAVNFSGECPTLIVHNPDQPGYVAEVSSLLLKLSVNIATMQLYRSGRDGQAVMIIECDQEIPAESLEWLRSMKGIEQVTYYSP